MHVLQRSLLTVTGLCALATITASARPVAHRLDNGLARTPPMGWNSWNRFGCNVSDKLIREVADAIGANGMREPVICTSPSTIAGRWRTGRTA